MRGVAQTYNTPVGCLFPIFRKGIMKLTKNTKTLITVLALLAALAVLVGVMALAERRSDAISKSSLGERIAPLYALSAEDTTRSAAENDGYPFVLMSLFASSHLLWRESTVS